MLSAPAVPGEMGTVPRVHPLTLRTFRKKTFLSIHSFVHSFIASFYLICEM